MRRLRYAAILALACARHESSPPPRAHATPTPRALALGYGGHARAEFDAQRLKRNHTLSLWFLATYDAAGRQILLSDQSGHYHVGLAPYAAQGAVAMEFTLGSTTLTAPLLDPHLTDNDFRNGAPKQTPPHWRHLALCVQDQHARAFVDGKLLAESSFDAIEASGALLFGRLPQTGELQDQYYGLIDDVVLFARALDDSEIRALSQRRQRTANPADLLASWTFDDDASIKLSGAATLISLKPGLPTLRPNLSTHFELPFTPDQVWLVIQGNNSGLSHHDEAAFALDFLRVDPAVVTHDPEHLPGGSHALSLGQPVLASAAGQVVAIVDCYGDDNRGNCDRGASAAQPGAIELDVDPAHRNLVCLRHAPEEYSCYLHLQHRSTAVALGQQVHAGDVLGRVGQTGARQVHLHFAISNAEEANAPGTFTNLVTRPFEFHDYSASNDFGQSWQYMEHGSPTPGQWLRRGRVPATLTTAAGPGVSAPP